MDKSNTEKSLRSAEAVGSRDPEGGVEVGPVHTQQDCTQQRTEVEKRERKQRERVSGRQELGEVERRGEKDKRNRLFNKLQHMGTL
jgi:hypothetical protein